MADNSITLVGNITDDPELRFTPGGQAVANFKIAVNRRYTDRNGQWQDKLDGFFRCNCWGSLAENVAESIQKGTRVLVTGRLEQRTWDDQEGKKRYEVEIRVDEVGPSLKWATAQVQKSSRAGSAQRPAAAGETTGGATGGDWSSPAPVGGSAGDEGF